MPNPFKRKSKSKESPVDKPGGIAEERQESLVGYVFKRLNLSLQDSDNRYKIKDYYKSTGDQVTIGDLICDIRSEYHLNPIEIHSAYDGYLEICTPVYEPTIHVYFEDSETIFKIHLDLENEEKKLDLKNKRFENTPHIELDEFTGFKEINWKGVAGKIQQSEHWNDLADCLIFHSDDENFYQLLFTLGSFEGKDYIIFKHLSQGYKITVGSKVKFLFESNEIVEFEITQKPSKQAKTLNLGNIFQTKVPITLQELEILKNTDLIKWQIEISKTNEKIVGSIDSDNDHFAIKKLAKEYHNIVQKEIEDYKPFVEKVEDQNIVTNEVEECYLYLMIDLKNNYHKIGISNKPEYREKTLQSEKPSIEMICNKRFPNRKIATSFEQALHQTYADKRIRGEWFNLDEKDIVDIKETLN